MTEQQKFINQLKIARDYWLSLSNKTKKEVVDGVLFSLLVMFDGDSSTNNFHRLRIIDTKSGKHIDDGCLHTYYHSENEDASEENIADCEDEETKVVFVPVLCDGNTVLQQVAECDNEYLAISEGRKYLKNHIEEYGNFCHSYNVKIEKRIVPVIKYPTD